MTVGDVVSFSGANLISALIATLTYGPFAASHVAIVGELDGRLMLFEALPEGVVANPIEKRINRYVGRVHHWPLYRRLFGFEKNRLNRFLNDALGLPYDLAGAVKAGGYLLAAAKNIKSRSDSSSYFCAELVAQALSDVGVFATGNPSRFSPNSLIRSMRRAGVLQSPERLK